MSVPEAMRSTKIPLSARIREAEREINLHRYGVSQRTTILKKDLREKLVSKLVSPGALFAYTGMGFVAGTVMLCRPKSNKQDHSRHDAGQESRGHGGLERLIANAVKIIALTRTIGSFFPESSPPAPNVTVVTPPEGMIVAENATVSS